MESSPTPTRCGAAPKRPIRATGGQGGFQAHDVHRSSKTLHRRRIAMTSAYLANFVVAAVRHVEAGTVGRDSQGAGEAGGGSGAVAPPPLGEPARVVTTPVEITIFRISLLNESAT